MNLTEAQIALLEDALRQLEEVDPADLPEPAAELAAMLGRLLDGSDDD